jgi:hypothetical protein
MPDFTVRDHGAPGEHSEMAAALARLRSSLTLPSILFAKVFHDCNHAKDDRWKQDRDGDRRAAFGRCNSQRHKREKQRCRASDQSPFGQQSPECVAMPLFWDRAGLWPAPHGSARQLVSDVRSNSERSDRRAAELKLGNRPKQEVLPGDADVFPRDKKVPAKWSEHAHDSDSKPRRADTQVRTPRMLIPSPIQPDCQRTRRSGSTGRFGNFAISRNQPDKTARIVLTVSHSDAKNRGKKTAKFCSIHLFNRSCL